MKIIITNKVSKSYNDRVNSAISNYLKKSLNDKLWILYQLDMDILKSPHAITEQNLNNYVIKTIAKSNSFKKFEKLVFTH